jgi:hypothetical protein
MRVLAILTVLLFGACSTPTPTPAVTRAPATVPTPNITEAPTSSLTVAPAVAVGEWSATCDGVEVGDCEGVAALFVNNLARGWRSVFDQSGGKVSVEPRPVCPAVPDWADPHFCWQATASVSSGPICMVIARQAVARYAGFGQVGGDAIGRAARPPSGWPTCT